MKKVFSIFAIGFLFVWLSGCSGEPNKERLTSATQLNEYDILLNSSIIMKYEIYLNGKKENFVISNYDPNYKNENKKSNWAEANTLFYKRGSYDEYKYPWTKIYIPENGEYKVSGLCGILGDKENIFFTVTDTAGFMRSYYYNLYKSTFKVISEQKVANK